MKLTKLLERLTYQCKEGTVDREISTLCYDSRKVEKDSIFVCITGVVSDGHTFVNEVIKKGATVIIAEKEVSVSDGVTLLLVSNTREALAYLSAAYFDYPAEKLKTIGITGTKGKTTTTYMVHSILSEAGIKTGLIGTIETIIGDTVIPANNTTPESYLVQQYFAMMVEAGCTCVVMEVSSQGLMLHRVSGFTFDIGVFTNMEPDHIGPGEHGSFEEYMACKGLLFTQCKVGIANVDDKHMEQVLSGHTCTLETYGLSEKADLRAVDIDLHSKLGNLMVLYNVKGLCDFPVQVNIPGTFTVYNSLTAIAICRHFHISTERIKEVLTKVKVKGRVEPVEVSKKFTMMIDYAHNAMSLQSVLSTLREYEPKRLVCLFGCGGNRSKDRRSQMGEISSNLADYTIVTSDNPRFEEPQDILNDIVVGVKRGIGKYIAILDRKEAIRHSILTAKEGDIILIAGKGHENYQEIRGVKYHMDDRELVQEIIAEMTSEQRNAL